MGIINFIRDFFAEPQQKFPEEYKQYPDRNRLRVIAKRIHCNDAEYMYASKAEQPGCCPVCHCKLEQIPNLNYRMGRRRNDMYYTYDGYCLVSSHFKRFCEERGYLGLIFIKLPKTYGFYFFTCKEETFLLEEQWMWRAKYKQPCCGVYYFAGGPYPIKRKDVKLQSDDFILATQMMGECYRRSNDIIIGLDTMKAMKDYGLKGIYFVDVYDLVDLTKQQIT